MYATDVVALAETGRSADALPECLLHGWRLYVELRRIGLGETARPSSGRRRGAKADGPIPMRWAEQSGGTEQHGDPADGGGTGPTLGAAAPVGLLSAFKRVPVPGADSTRW